MSLAGARPGCWPTRCPVLSDLDGPIGVGTQALLIAQRPVREPQPA